MILPDGVSARRLLVAASLTVALILGTGAYLDGSRPEGDRLLAKSALEGLTFMMVNYATTDGTVSSYSSGLAIHLEPIDLYLRSDSADRLPAITAHIDRAWRAYLVADQVWRLYDQGETRPRVIDIFGASELIAEEPTLQAAIITEGSDERLNNDDLAFVRLLFEVASRERSAASQSTAALAH
ncbi:MAG: hypothetical protein ACYC6C_06010 [Coriobacteriia bacterium]